jgi:hypothetical protein
MILHGALGIAVPMSPCGPEMTGIGSPRGGI